MCMRFVFVTRSHKFLLPVRSVYYILRQCAVPHRG